MMSRSPTSDHSRSTTEPLRPPARPSTLSGALRLSVTVSDFEGPAMSYMSNASALTM